MKELSDKALDELGRVMSAIDEDAVACACDMIAAARNIVVFGCGRENLQLSGFAMRLFHLGCSVAVAGDMTTPPVGPGDLLIASAGPGELATVTAIMERAKGAGANVLFLTAVPHTPCAALADRILEIPAQTMANDTGGTATSVLPMGSLYEGALFVLFEIMVLMLRERLGQTAQDMRARHTNME